MYVCIYIYKKKPRVAGMLGTPKLSDGKQSPTVSEKQAELS